MFVYILGFLFFQNVGELIYYYLCLIVDVNNSEWIPAFAGMTRRVVGMTRSGEWIPAFAGMTRRVAGMTRRVAGMTRSGEWIPAFAGMTRRVVGIVDVY